MHFLDLRKTRAELGKVPSGPIDCVLRPVTTSKFTRYGKIYAFSANIFFNFAKTFLFLELIRFPKKNFTL